VILLVFGVVAALNFQGSPPAQPPKTPPTPASAPAQQGRRGRTPVVRDSTPDEPRDSASGRRHQGVRRAVTAELQATAFKDATAKITLLAARAARLKQDSALVAYDATTYERISVGFGFGSIGRDRLLFRHEAATHVRWRQGVGAYVDVKGARNAAPMLGTNADVEINNDMNDPDLMGEIPYYPGYEPLWVGGGDIARAQVDETEIVHPIADGAEAYYTYETGDSVSFKLPDGKVIQLRELRVRPRQPKWNLGVGSLWFDTHSGQLVRAAYRLSVPMDIWAVATEDDPKSMDDVPVWVKPLITPMKAEVSAIAVEYSLHEGRFWLPRLRLAEGYAQVSFMRVPVKVEESFKYASVNGTDTLPTIHVSPGRPQPPDSLSDEMRIAWRDSVRAASRVHSRAQRDSVSKGLKRAAPQSSQCDSSGVRVTTSRRYDVPMAVAVRVPCDTAKLSHSPDLPPSIYDSGEELFDAKDLADLKAQALSLTAQAPLQLRLSMLPPPTISYGPALMRYNRVEGFSVGASVEQQLGGGYSGLAVGRLGFADLEPNVELSVARSNLTKTIRLTAYNRLVSASDWGHPLSFGSSFSALMFGRDEGFYYRASGVDLTRSLDGAFGGGAQLGWRVFAEQERTAAVKTNFAVDGSDFPANLVAQRGGYLGLSAHVDDVSGLDPQGLRIFSSLRFESAIGRGDSAYGRAAFDVTASHGLGRVAASLTASAGASVGELPPQRRWYLGGSQTVRGQSPDTAQSGNAFWLTRAELGTNDAGIRPALFADLGWVGDRTQLSQIGRPMSGVGTGVSFLDGLFRFDVARGLYPRKQFRVDLYLESKF
jgi:Omp85 superfamily domain